MKKQVTPSCSEYSWLQEAHTVCKYEPVRVTPDQWYPRGWDIGPTFDGPLPQAQLDTRSHGHSTKGNLYIYIHAINEAIEQHSVNGQVSTNPIR